MTSRTQQLTDWVSKTLKVTEFLIEPASSDASFRQYYRISFDGKTFIVMDAPPDKEDSQPFIDVGKLLLNAGLNVPKVLDYSLAHGFLLLSDLGNNQYLQALKKNSVDQLYSDAFNALHLMRSTISVSECKLPAYNRQLLSNEMELFREWFLTKHLQISLTQAHHTLLDDAFEFLIRSALAQPKICVHRDYHSRNLMVTKTNNPGVLDFQDAVIGPLTYDLVSLLRDCYIDWPREQVEAWVKQYHAGIVNEGIVGYESDELLSYRQLLIWFDLMGIQRHLKATGIFSRLNIRDGKPGYLKDIPRTLGYVVDVSQRYIELGKLNDFLLKKVLPLLTNS